MADTTKTLQDVKQLLEQATQIVKDLEQDNANEQPNQPKTNADQAQAPDPATPQA